MKTQFARVLAALTLCAGLQQAAAQGTAFTYQGQLQNNGSPANGSYSLTFALFNTNTSGAAIAGPVTNNAVNVTNGLFTVVIDFGPGVFTGATNWLQIGVTNNGGNAFTPLSPRQQLTPTPYAIYSANAGMVAATNVSGPLSLGQLPPAVLTNSETSVNLSGTFAGNGGGLTNLAAWQLGGNTGTTNGNFLGTTDNRPLEIRVGGVRAGWISLSNSSPNIVLGPAQNSISNATVGASILGGSNNVIATNSSYSVIGGGSQNSISNNAGYSLLGGGSGNTIQAGDDHSVLVGGNNNTLQGGADFSVLGGGSGNSIQTSATYSFLGGGLGNSIYPSAQGVFIGGGLNNNINEASGSSSYEAALVGGNGNSIYVGSAYAFLGGGTGNLLESSPDSVIVGGSGNTVSTTYAFLGGGLENNIASGGGYSVLVGGAVNNLQGSAQYSFLGGGQRNIVSGNWATVGGGYQNSATTNYATVPGGSNNVASGPNSFAAGAYAQAINPGAFVWADAEGTPFASTTANQFNVRANGGVRFVTSGAGLSVDGQPVLAGLNVLTNNEPNVSLGNLTLTGNLNLNGGYINSGGSTVLFNDNLKANFFAGGGAGNLAASGSYNTAVGSAALAFDTSGYYNTAQGASALYENTSGYDNTADGFAVLYNNTVGSNNVASGWAALYSNTNGSQNVAIGSSALAGNTSGSENTALGTAALANSTTALGNTALGYSALSSLTSGSGNLGLGFLAGYSLTSGNNNIDIGNAGAGSDNGIIRIGTPGAQTQTYIAGVINGNGSGLTNLPAIVVTNNEPFVVLGALGVNNLLLSGTLSLPLPASISSQGTALLSADQNGNAYFGLQAGAGTGANNTAIGDYALEVNGTGSGNTALGNDALSSITSGTGNIGIGYQGGSSLTTGNNNIDIGNSGVSSDSGVIRIGNGQSETYLAGTVNCFSLSTAFFTSGAITTGDVNSSGSITCCSMTIAGGCDLAEPFAISTPEKAVSEGAVVVIDEANPGQLKLTDQSYDTRVAGVVSGANGIHPGIQMHQQGLLEGGKNVALTGRVYVQADTSNGAIKPGDLLTTSSTPGRAMKVTDHTRAQGAILGKAMTGLSEGSGMVLVLVTLQ